MKFNFHFGNKEPDIVQYIIVGITLSTLIATLSQCTGVSQDGLWDILDEIQRRYFPQTIVGKIINKSPDKIDRRIKRDVNSAIKKVTPEYDRIIAEADEKYKPRYTEEKNDDNLCYTDECKALSPPMRITAVWYIENTK